MSKADEIIAEMMKKRDRAAKKIALFVEGQAKNNAHVKTGTLKRSITHEVETDQHKSVSTIGTNVEYAYWQEKGTSKMKAHPFLLPAIENNLDEIKRIIEEEMKF